MSTISAAILTPEKHDGSQKYNKIMSNGLNIFKADTCPMRLFKVNIIPKIVCVFIQSRKTSKD